MVQRTSARGINRYGRTSQGVRLMNLRSDDIVSAVAVVVEPETPPAALPGAAPTEPVDAAEDPAAAAAAIESGTGSGIDDSGLADDGEAVDGVMVVDAEDDSLLLPPEVEEEARDEAEES